MDEAQRAVVRSYSREELAGMTMDEVAALIETAGAKAKFKGKAVVRGPDGKIKYDADAVPDRYGETAEEMGGSA